VTEEAAPPSISHVPMSSVIARLEKELRELWHVEPGEAARSRACTMNLVVVTTSPAITEHYLPIVEEVTQSIPSRAIVVTMTPNDPDASLDGEAQAICGVDNLTCSERVTLRARGSACARVESAVESLMVPELGTTLVWLGRIHVDDPVFRELAEYAQRVVLDTEYTSLTSLLLLSRWARDRQSKIGIADLAWTRIAAWQEMCARFFDDPQMRPLADKVEVLRIVQMSDPGVRLGAEGGLMLGWLATRLGWRIEALGGEIRFKRADGKAVKVELASMKRPPEVAPLAIASVMLRASDGNLTATGTVARDFDGDVADVLRYKLDVNLPASGEQTVRLGANKGARVLERTLHRPAHDETLAEAVAFAEKLDDDGAVVT
jgi:glucose-6-phosphate dehydrogenase assembly protein OpcA